MIFKQLFDYATWTYTYLLADNKTKRALLIDPVIEQVDRDLNLLNELNLKLIYSIETHLHADHITASGKLRDITNCQTIIPSNANADCANKKTIDGEIIELDGIELKVIFTPGHTDSHNAYLANNKLLFSGDSLFIRGCGRTDFQSGNPAEMYDSVVNKLFTLKDDVLVYPGHDYNGFMQSTIEEEKRFNPRFVGKSKTEFIFFMQNLKLPNPKRIMEAVPANEKCGKV